MVKTRHYSFIVPFLMDGALGLAQTAAPLLAIRFGATALFLGALGFYAQLVRLPFCMTMGGLSDCVGRVRVIIPAAAAISGAMVAMALSHSNTHLLLAYIAAIAGVGAFYPPLQAMIGDHSPRGELTRNLSHFNVGWCVGGSLLALSAGYLLKAAQPLPFVLGAICAVAALLLVLHWHGNTKLVGTAEAPAATSAAGSDSGSLLLIARLGHFLGFFALGAGRYIFPKLARTIGFDEGRTGVLVGMLLVGQALGIGATSLRPWWKGKIWPQILAQAMVLVAALIIYITSAGVIFAAAFLMLGISLGIAYTAALYYGIQSRTNMGRNTSIHESLVALGGIFGALSGGLVAQNLSLRAPYLIIAGLAAAFLVTTAAIAAFTSSGSSRS